MTSFMIYMKNGVAKGMSRLRHARYLQITLDSNSTLKFHLEEYVAVLPTFVPVPNSLSVKMLKFNSKMVLDAHIMKC